MHWLFVGMGVLLALLGIPLMQRRVPPNALYGFRTPTTLHNPSIWYEVNAQCGKDCIAVGALVALTSSLLALGGGSPSLVLLPTGLLVAGTLTMTVRGLLLVRRLRNHGG